METLTYKIAAMTRLVVRLSSRMAKNNNSVLYLLTHKRQNLARFNPYYSQPKGI